MLLRWIFSILLLLHGLIHLMGFLKAFEVERYYDRKDEATLEPWLITIYEQSYRTFEGIRVPTRAEVTWSLDAGDFTWFELEVVDLTYNEL